MTATATTFRRRDHELMKAAHADEEITYKIDEKGRKVRVATETRRVLQSEIIEAISGVRVVDEEDMLEAVGKNVFKYMVRKGYLMEADGWFWVTERAAKTYSLAPVTTEGLNFKFPRLDG